MKIMIVNGGALTKAFLTEAYEAYQPQMLIAVDGALTILDRAGICPTHLVGDFDTVACDLLRKYEQNPDIFVERHNPQKDETDSELALLLALKQNPEEIRIYGALGMRMDHALGNVELLLRALESKVCCSIRDETNSLFLIAHEAWVAKEENMKYLSFLPFTDEVEGVTLEGVCYPLRDARLTRGMVRTVSNEWQEGQTAHILVKKGILLCICCRDSGNNSKCCKK